MTLAFCISLYLTIGLFDLMARNLWVGVDDRGVVPGLLLIGVLVPLAATWPVRAAVSFWRAL
ncbi:hypothetical protein [Henriciella aquimarina]|uniref:hypothetical protein n=1 Tax=Henriciella aquimarina TaxID=545261 RepID=UPI0009FE0BCD|nr:hypothetical protein [Henriciella aquimarina]